MNLVAGRITVVNPELGLAALSRLLDTALDLPPEQRAAWIDALDASHDELKPRLRALLARAPLIESRDFLGRLPPLPMDLEEAAALDKLAAGTRIGPYLLVRPLGSGGMGSVWLASRADGLFERAVALKLPHRGIFGADLPGRMAHERRILAALDHPNIARLHDAGLTEDGQPFLALEFVEGVSVDEYCRANALDIHARLLLFLQVVDAIAAAHAQLVVHRDLKPANILVTRDGAARLLDFGIAKLLDAQAEDGKGHTQFAMRAFTPDYASPEQIRGESVTIASDIYSLGVILYELLSGQRPYHLRRDTRGALEDAILDAEPRRPSEVAHSRALRGDLDTIVLKALHKAPAERYSTANAFADDLRRHLEKRPVLARPDGAWYRTSRFLRRHALGSSLALLISVAIVATAGIALRQAHVANLERQRAEVVSRFARSIFTDADPFAGGGRELRALDLLKQARARVDKELAPHPAQHVAMLNTIAVSLCHLSDPDAADEVSRSSLAIAMRELPEESPERHEARMVRLEVHRARSDNESLRRDVDQLLGEAERDESISDVVRIRLLTYSAHAAIDEGNNSLAAEQATRAFSMATATLDELDPLVIEAGALQAVALRYAGETDRALEAGERNLRLSLAAAAGNPADARVLDVRMGLGSIYTDLARPRDAIRELEAAATGAQRLYGPDSAFEMYARAHLARALCEAGDAKAALAEIERTLSIAAAQPDEESRNAGVATGIRGHILSMSGRHAEALRDFDVALAYYRQNFGPEHQATAGLQMDRAVTLAHLDRQQDALRELEVLVPRWQEIKHWMVVSPDYMLGIAQRLDHRPEAALLTQRAALAALPNTPRRERARMAILGELGRSALMAGHVDQARPALEEALTLHRKFEVETTLARAAVEAALRELEAAAR